MRGAKKSALGILLALAMVFGALGVGMVASRTAHAAPAKGVHPLTTECGAPGWVTVSSVSYAHTIGSSTYKATDSLQETYDSAFGTWCGAYRTKVVFTAPAGSAGGTDTAYAQQCGISSNRTTGTLNFPSGGGSWTFYSSVNYNIPVQGQGGDYANVVGNTWTDTMSCAGN